MENVATIIASSYCLNYGSEEIACFSGVRLLNIKFGQKYVPELVHFSSITLTQNLIKFTDKTIFPAI